MTRLAVLPSKKPMSGLIIRENHHLGTESTGLTGFRGVFAWPDYQIVRLITPRLLLCPPFGRTGGISSYPKSSYYPSFSPSIIH